MGIFGRQFCPTGCPKNGDFPELIQYDTLATGSQAGPAIFRHRKNHRNRALIFQCYLNSYKFHKFVFYTQLQPSLIFVLNWCSHFMFAPRTLDLGDKSPSVAATSTDGDLLTPAGSAVETAKHRCSGRTWKCSCRAWWRRFRFLGKTREDFGGLSSSPLLVDD